jgi:hypothetical protein
MQGKQPLHTSLFALPHRAASLADPEYVTVKRLHSNIASNSASFVIFPRTPRWLVGAGLLQRDQKLGPKEETIWCGSGLQPLAEAQANQNERRFER